MKTILLMIIAALFCIVNLSNFSIANMTALIQPSLNRSFPLFESNSKCTSLALFYQNQAGHIKPIALKSLPIEYYLHESIPRQYRPFFYVAADTWNRKLKQEVIRISSEIDRNPINIEHARSNQKNVIYLIDREYSREISINFNRNRLEDIDFFLPGISRHSLSKALDASGLFLPIAETDMMIREEILTDLETYRHHLITSLQELGAEEPFFDLNVHELRKMVSSHLENMSVEEYRSLAISDSERKRQTISNNSPTMRVYDLQNINQDIEKLRNMEHGEVQSLKYDEMTRFLNADIEMMETSSSITLVTAVMHEMGHGLGLNHIPSNSNRPLMEVEIYSRPSQITIPKEIDSQALDGMRCLYTDILSYY